MRILIFLFVALLALVTTTDARKKPPPKDACGRAWVYDNNIESFMRYDNICRHVDGEFREVYIFRGCECFFYTNNGDACTNPDGFVSKEGNKEHDRVIWYTRGNNVNWYMCRRLP